MYINIVELQSSVLHSKFQVIGLLVLIFTLNGRGGNLGYAIPRKAPYIGQAVLEKTDDGWMPEDVNIVCC